MPNKVGMSLKAVSFPSFSDSLANRESACVDDNRHPKVLDSVQREHQFVGNYRLCTISV